MGFKFHQICRVQKARLLYQQSKTSTTYALKISILKAIKRLVNVYNTSAEYVHLPFIAQANTLITCNHVLHIKNYTMN